MKSIKLILLLSIILLLNSCASGYRVINPDTLNYVSSDAQSGVTMEYKYDLLQGKYAKKEAKKDIKLVAIKITNNTENDLIFGRDIKLVYENGSAVNVIDNDKVFKSLKQSAPTYLLYLLLTPVNFYTANANGEQTSSIPVGLIAGPGIAGGNMIAAGTANKKFKEELLEYNIFGTTIQSGQTSYGLVGIQSGNFDTIKIKIE